MAKSKPQDSDSSGSKRKKDCCEIEVCVEENMDRKVKKKRKKLETEEEPAISQDDAQIATKPEKHKQPTEHTQTEKKRKKKKQVEEEPPISEQPTEPTEHTQTEKKRKKKKQVEIAEPTAAPSVTQGEEEEDVDLSPEEIRVLERKMKKILKKNKLKTEGKTEGEVEATKPIAPQQALDYLTCWAENRKEWKFQKTRQTWLLQHMFDSDKVPDQSFSVLLSYLEGLRGAARDTTVKKAETLVQGLGEGAEVEEEAQKRAQRAREVIQLLS